jgi:hypothetical protein
MSYSCYNTITIICHHISFADEIDNIILELYNSKETCDYKEYNDYETIQIIKKGKRGVVFNLTGEWQPDYEWLTYLLDKCPNCLIKNEWYQVDGRAGVWVGSVDNTGNKDIKDIQWDDIPLEGKHDIFT